MSLATRLAALATAIGTDVKDHETRLDTLEAGGATGDGGIVKLADQAFATSSFVLDNDLFFQSANAKWTWFKFWIIYTVNATTTGARFAVNGAGTSLYALSQKMITVPGTSSTDMMSTALLTGSGVANPVSTAEPAASPTLLHAQIEGMIDPAGSTQVGLTVQSEVAVANGVVVKAGSFCRWKQLEA